MPGAARTARYNRHMSADTRRLLIIFAVLAAAVAAPFVFDFVRESRRPVLAEARVVTATSSDPVFRSGRRQVAPGDEVRIALAVRIEKAGRGVRWLAPVEALAIDGEPVQHVRSDGWPERERTIRVFWFTVECRYVGGVLTADNAAERLSYQTYLAPEMGRGLLALRPPDLHNDDHLGETGAAAVDGAGTVRLYARAELVEEAGDLRPLQAVTSLDLEHLLDPRFPAVLRGAELGAGVRPAAGELFGLPGFEPAGASPAARDAVTEAAFGRRFSALVEERLVVSSWTLAAVAATGRADPDLSAFAELGELVIGDERLSVGGRPAAWGREVVPGDLLVDGEHWLVLLADNGDGALDLADTVLHSWQRPPVRTTLFAALDPEVSRVVHRRAAP